MAENEQEIVVDSIFSVYVFRIKLSGLSDEIGLESILKKELKKNKIKGILDGTQVIPAGDQVEQSYPELHLKEKVRPLCDKIVNISEYIAKDVLFFNPSYKTEITGMWANRQKPGKTLERHRHHNNIFAGVFYISDGDFPPISFLNPCDPQMKPTVTQYNNFNSGIWHIPAHKDTLLIFPAYIDHKVDANRSDKDRYSISFNIMFRGQYDEKESLQSIIL